MSQNTEYPTPVAGVMDIEPYVAGKSSKDSRKRQIKLSSNENSYGPSPKAIDAYRREAYRLNHYPDGSASIVRNAISEVHGYSADNIVCGVGSDELIGLLVQAYAGQGDEVLYTEHGFLMYKIYSLAAGATPVEAREVDMKTDIDSLLSRVTEKTKIVFIANPNNPTGSYITSDELEELRDRLPDNIILAIDAAYAEYAEYFSERNPHDFPDYSAGAELVRKSQESGKHNVVMLRTFSKIYALPALRIGWMYAPSKIIDVFHRIKSPFNVTSVAQAAAAAAMLDTAYTSTQQALNADGMNYLNNELKKLSIVKRIYPSIGNFILVDTGCADVARSVIEKLEESNIYVRGVAGYKLPSCIRISIGKTKENEQLISALREIVI